MPGRHEYRDTRDEKLQALTNELWRARQAIIDLMPPAVAEVLSSYHCCTFEQKGAWQTETVEKLIDAAETLPTSESPYFSERRARCPLCGSGSMSPYTEGFAVPEGLRRHLVGSGNAAQCEVMHAAAALARDYFREKFRAVEAAREAEKTAKKKLREATETLYRTGPSCLGKLVDDGIWFKEPRTADGLAWAEKRLLDLGFELVIDGRVRAYTKGGENWLVYADPRAVGMITFRLYRPSKRKTAKGKASWGPTPREFTIHDQWKNDLTGKFASRLAELLESSR